MNEKSSRISEFAIALLVIIVFYLGHTFAAPKDSLVKIRFFDVGQGDAALITNNHNQSILIDGGPNSKVVDKASSALPFYQRKITSIILTHPHADHLIGLISILDKYEVGSIYVTGVVHTTPEYYEFYKK